MQQSIMTIYVRKIANDETLTKLSYRNVICPAAPNLKRRTFLHEDLVDTSHSLFTECIDRLSHAPQKSKNADLF